MVHIMWSILYQPNNIAAILFPISDVGVRAFWSISRYEKYFSRNNTKRDLWEKIGLIHTKNVDEITLIQFRKKNSQFT